MGTPRQDEEGVFRPLLYKTKIWHDTCPYTGRKLTRPGIKLIGAKSRSRAFLYQLAPEKYDCYIEPFVGSGTVLIGLPETKMEIVGDINSGVINYYRQIQRHPEALWEQIQEEVEYIQADGGTAWKWIRDHEPPENTVGHAAWFYVLSKFSMNGIVRFNKSGKCNSSWCKTTKGRGIFTPDWYSAVCQRIRNVQFFHKDYKELLKYAEAPGRPEPKDTWVFLDPPYLQKSKKTPDGCVTTYNGIRFKEEDHEELAYILSKSQCMWMLTINDSEAVRSLYKGQLLIPHRVLYSCSQTAQGRSRKPELIIIGGYEPRRMDNLHISGSGS